MTRHVRHAAAPAGARQCGPFRQNVPVLYAAHNQEAISEFPRGDFGGTSGERRPAARLEQRWHDDCLGNGDADNADCTRECLCAPPQRFSPSAQEFVLALRVLVIDRDMERAALVRHALAEADSDLMIEVATGSGDLIVLLRAAQPDVVIIDLDLPDRDTIEQLRVATREMPRPIVMFVDRSEDSAMRAAIAAGVSAYIVDGLQPKRVKPIVDVAVARFQAFEELRRELELARTSLADRKLIDRAKGIIMAVRGISEEEAYTALRSKAMKEQKKLGEIARSIITAAELLQ